MALTLITNRFVHITAQKALEAFPLLFPMPREYAKMTINAFLEIFEKAEAIRLKTKIVENLILMWEAMDARSIMVLLCRKAFESEYAEPLAVEILKLEVAFGEDEREDAKASYEVIGRRFPNLEQSCLDRIGNLSIV
jgi:hypothetical protein